MIETSRAPETVDRVLFSSQRARVGAFRCHPACPGFDSQGEISGFNFVFPRTSVWIRHAGERPFVADAATVTFYNLGQEYRREPLDPRGDHSDWFSVDHDIAVEATSLFERIQGPAAERPWRFSHAPVEPRVYWRQRLIVERLQRGTPVDELQFEDEVIGLLVDVLSRAYGAETPPPVSGSQERLVERARLLLAERFREAFTLSDMAASLRTSVFHLSRVFRRVTGLPLHVWRHRLRLHAALEAVASREREHDLTGIALELGFSSHSHFTCAFRTAFGQTPTEFARSFRAARSRPRRESVGC